MTKAQLKQKMIEAEEKYEDDYEALHSAHDELLLKYIGDAEIRVIFERTPKYCA